MKYELPVNVILPNNKQLGMIAQEQKEGNYPNWQTDLYNYYFAEYAENCGGTGAKVPDPGSWIEPI